MEILWISLLGLCGGIFLVIMLVTCFIGVTLGKEADKLNDYYARTGWRQ